MGTSDCLWGLLDGINEDGLAVSLTFGGRPVLGDGFGVPLVLRYLLETCSTVAEAAAVLARLPVPPRPHADAGRPVGRGADRAPSPDRGVAFRPTPAATNHQDVVEWTEHAAVTRTLEREACILALLDDASTTAEGFVQAFLAPPLRTTTYSRGFGTLYTAAYNLPERTVDYVWLGAALEPFPSELRAEHTRRVAGRGLGCVEPRRRWRSSPRPPPCGRRPPRPRAARVRLHGPRQPPGDLPPRARDRDGEPLGRPDLRVAEDAVHHARRAGLRPGDPVPQHHPPLASQLPRDDLRIDVRDHDRLQRLPQQRPEHLRAARDGRARLAGVRGVDALAVSQGRQRPLPHAAQPAGLLHAPRRHVRGLGRLDGDAGLRRAAPCPAPEHPPGLLVPDARRVPRHARLPEVGRRRLVQVVAAVDPRQHLVPRTASSSSS